MPERVAEYGQEAIHHRILRVTLKDTLQDKALLLHESAANSLDIEQVCKALNTLSYYLPPQMRVTITIDRFDTQ